MQSKADVCIYYSLEVVLLLHNDVRATKALGRSVKHITRFFNDMDPEDLSPFQF